MPTATMTATAQAGDRGRTPPSRESSRSTPPLQLLMLLVRLCGKAVFSQPRWRVGMQRKLPLLSAPQRCLAAGEIMRAFGLSSALYVAK